MRRVRRTAGAWAALAVMLLGLSGCVGARVQNPEECQESDRRAGVIVTPWRAIWNRQHDHASEPADASHMNLVFPLNLEPRAGRFERTYAGFAHDGVLGIHLAAQFRDPALRPAGGVIVEISAAGRTAQRDVSETPTVAFEGPDLDAMLLSRDDIRIRVIDANGAVLHEDRVTRAHLRRADAAMRRLSAVLYARLRDPAQSCPINDEIAPTGSAPMPTDGGG